MVQYRKGFPNGTIGSLAKPVLGGRGGGIYRWRGSKVMEDVELVRYWWRRDAGLVCPGSQ